MVADSSIRKSGERLETFGSSRTGLCSLHLVMAALHLHCHRPNRSDFLVAETDDSDARPGFICVGPPGRVHLGLVCDITPSIRYRCYRVRYNDSVAVQKLDRTITKRLVPKSECPAHTYGATTGCIRTRRRHGRYEALCFS